MSALSSTRPTMLDQLELVHGPRQLLGKFFLHAFEDARVRGVILSFSTFEEFSDVNARNQDSWRPLTPAFDPHAGGFDESDVIYIVGRNRDGDVVATQANRLFVWDETDFKQEAESLRLFYANPLRDRADGESCVVSAPAALRIRGRVAYGGGIWYRPDFRHGRLSTLLPRIGRAYAHTRWDLDYECGIMTERTVASGFADRLRLSAVEWDVIRTNVPAFARETNRLRLALGHITASDIIDDTFGYLLEASREVDAVVGERRA